MKPRALLAALAVAALAQNPPLLPPVEMKPETVVATVDGVDITLADVRKLADSDPRLLTFLQQNPQQALAQAYMVRHLAAEADRHKLAEQSPLKEQLQMVRAQVLTNAMVNHERDTFPVSSEAIDEYFQRNRASYEQARIRAIYLAFKPASAAPAGTSPEEVQEAARQALEASRAQTGRTEAEAEALANDILRRLREGADFTAMVQQYSEDPSSKSSGGDFGVIKADSSLPEAIRRPVASMQAGEVTGPIKSGSGMYLIRVEEKVLPPLADVRGDIVQAIRQNHLNEFMNALQNRFQPVVKNPDFFSRPGAALGVQK